MLEPEQMTREDSRMLYLLEVDLEEAVSDCTCYPKIDGQCDACCAVYETEYEIHGVYKRDEELRNES